MAEADEAMRERLGAALLRGDWFDLEDEGVQVQLCAGDLVATVRAIVADELRAVADWYWDDHDPGRMVHDDLKRRADALDPR